MTKAAKHKLDYHSMWKELMSKSAQEFEWDHFSAHSEFVEGIDVIEFTDKEKWLIARAIYLTLQHMRNHGI